MIIVEKQAKGAARNAARYCRSLADYMRTAKQHALANEYGIALTTYMRRDMGRNSMPDAEPRVLTTGALVGDEARSFDDAQLEIERRLARRSKRSRKPARHLVGSYREGEEPSPDDCADVARVLADELGCGDGVIAWALHGDTDNRHLHLLVLTLDADGQATSYGPRGQSHEAMQRAIARLEYTQQLKPEQGSRYVADDDGVRRRPQLPPKTVKRAPINTEVLRWEEETGLESFTRYAQDVLAPMLEGAGSWEQAQADCAEQGAVVRKHGSGGELQSADGLYKVKLSNVDRKLSWAQLTKRWGDWSEPEVDVQPYKPRVLDATKAAAWAEADERRAKVHDAVQGRIDRLRAEKAAAVEALVDELANRRGDVAALELEPAAHARMITALESAFGTRATVLKAEYDDRIAAVRELREEVDACSSPKQVDLSDIQRPDLSLSLAWPTQTTTPVAHPDFRAVVVGSSIQYWAAAGDQRQPAFVERGNRIWINDQSDAALMAALMVAKARYGDVAAYGDKTFILRAQMLGRELGMAVQDGGAVGTPPPRRRSPRAEINRAAARAAGQEARRKAAVGRRIADALSAMRARDDDEGWRADLPLELPSMPRSAIPNAETMDDVTAARNGMTFSSQLKPNSVNEERRLYVDTAAADGQTKTRARAGSADPGTRPPDWQRIIGGNRNGASR